MRRIACLIATLTLAPLHTIPACAQGNVPPHGWLFGAWTGGLFPPPSTLSAQECLALPVVIFTRDLVMRAVITDQLYTQRLVETARHSEGVESGFPARLRQHPPGPSACRLATPTRSASAASAPDILRVQRRRMSGWDDAAEADRVGVARRSAAAGKPELHPWP